MTNGIGAWEWDSYTNGIASGFILGNGASDYLCTIRTFIPPPSLSRAYCPITMAGAWRVTGTGGGHHF